MIFVGAILDHDLVAPIGVYISVQFAVILLMLCSRYFHNWSIICLINVM